jgi:hypothetical protein
MANNKGPDADVQKDEPADVDDDEFDGEEGEEFEDDDPSDDKDDDEDDEDDVAAPARPADDDEDDDEVEADLDAILKDRIAAGDDDDEDEDQPPRPAPAPAGEAEPVIARQDHEISCPNCFLLVNTASVIDGECPHCGGPVNLP